MSKPLSDAELQKRMAEYNGQVVQKIVSLFERPGMPHPRLIPAISDDDIDSAYSRYNEVRLCVAALHLAIQNYNKDCGDIRSIDEHAFLDFIHDEVPSSIAFQNALNEARRGE